ncbi:unnamed protein product (macronuclear) [Paramecium tetraurelia]|uniref:Uncharacterized protein n=1 Tax=Paramecium tetraurelia TaxID=5888 RepID=A0DJQ0_PARTE|nr:uncharacterized protein GSPATT00017611001 [Paramecium tetraurelia]CAK83267.1 unnamed protein product [Paramecium tetraurelia]|eukprot:XP_001450664.1 hypothetical protein (macronuclear) [Paramecium tetraurelia strain d4-2]
MGSYPSCFCCPQSYSKGKENIITDNEPHLTQFKQAVFNQAVQISPEDDSSLLQIMATYEQLVNRKSISTAQNGSSKIRSRSISVDNKYKGIMISTKQQKKKKIQYGRSLSASQYISDSSKLSTTQKLNSILKKRSNTQKSQFQKKSKNKVSFLPFILQCNSKKLIDIF